MRKKYGFKIMAKSATGNNLRAITDLLPPAYLKSLNQGDFTTLPVVKAEILASVGDNSCSHIAAVSQVEPAAMLQTSQQQVENYSATINVINIPFAHAFVLGHLLG